MKRGDVVLADFPFQDIPGSKVRPAVVVQKDAQPPAGYPPTCFLWRRAFLDGEIFWRLDCVVSKAGWPEVL
jgi:hypothetical protein